MKGYDIMRLTRSNSYVLLLIAAFLAFAAFTAGGCGGSGGDPVSIPTGNNGIGNEGGNNGGGETAELNLPSMFDIRVTPEFNAMVQRLKDSGVWAKVDSFHFYNVIEYLTPEELQEVLSEIPEEDRERFIYQNKMVQDELVSFYETGGILTLFHPSNADIERTLKFLKSVSADVAMVDISTDIEICAITKQTASGSLISPDNVVQLDNIFVYVVPDISTLVSIDFASSDLTPDDVEKEYVDMQVSRWERYFLWLAGLRNKAVENARAAAAIETSAAWDNNIVLISRVLAGTYDWSYSNLTSWNMFASEEDIPSIVNRDPHIVYPGSRTNILDYQVYSVHSFTDHSDYFLINSNLYTKPLKFEPEAKCYLQFIPHGYTWRTGLRGYTRSLSYNLSFGKGEYVKTSMPDGVPAGTKYQDNFTWSDEGIFAAQNFGFFEGMSYSGNISFDATNITVSNKSATSTAALEAVFDRPMEDPSSDWSGFTAYPASTVECRLPFTAVIRINSDDWKKGYDSVKLVFSGSVQEGETASHHRYYDSTGEYLYPRVNIAATKNFSLSIKNPNPPMHSTVHQRNYAYPKAPEEGIAGAAAVKILSETNWQLLVESTAEDWLIISGDKTSGNATGPEGEWVIFTAKENTTGQNRFAKLTLVSSPYDNKSKTEVTIVDVFQAGQ